MWEISGIFCEIILSVPQIVVMDMNNAMYEKWVQKEKNLDIMVIVHNSFSTS